MDSVSDSDRPILVTGGLGFVCNYVLKALIDAGIPGSRIVAMSQTPSPPSEYGRVYVQDLTEPHGLESMIMDVNPCAVIHLAAIAEPSEAVRNQGKAWKVNFDATRKLAEVMREHVPDARLVFAGSSESYGLSFNSEPRPIRENSALNPMNVYGATKAAADVCLGQMQHDGMDVVRFRAFNHTGPSQSPNYVVPAFAKQIADIEKGLQEPQLKVGNLDALRDFLDVRDVAAVYVAALFANRADLPNSAINISSGNPRPIRSIVDQLLAFSRTDISIEIDPDRLRPSEVPFAAGDNSLLKETLDWHPRYDFPNTVLDVLNGFR